MATRRHDTGQPEDAIELLRADHQKVRELFQDYENAQDQKAKHKIAQQVFVELETHAQLEENVFYPAFRRPKSSWEKWLKNRRRVPTCSSLASVW